MRWTIPICRIRADGVAPHYAALIGYSALVDGATSRPFPDSAVSWRQCCRSVDLLPRSVDFQSSLVTVDGLKKFVDFVEISVDLMTYLWISEIHKLFHG